MGNVGKYKGKVLFCHGYSQTSSTFYYKTAALRKQMEKAGFKPVYLNGPVKLTPAELSYSGGSHESEVARDESDGITNRAWWSRPVKNTDRMDIGLAVGTIKKYIDKGEIIEDEDLIHEKETEEERQLPVVGMVGFSQGAGLCGLIGHKFAQLFGQDSLRFMVIFSGFKFDTSSESGNHGYQDYYPPNQGANEKFRALHVFGELDTVLSEDESMNLYESMKHNSDLLKHPGGHFVPNSKFFVSQIIGWVINAHENKRTKDPPKQISHEDDLELLMDKISSLGKA